MPEQSTVQSLFPKVELCIWRDAFDPQRIVIGSVTLISTESGIKKHYTAWLTSHIDALLFFANRAMYDRIAEADVKDLPLPLELSLRIPD